MNRLLTALCLVLVALIFSCNKELSYIGGPDGPVNIVLPDPITAMLQGNIVDENGLPAIGVTVTVGTKTVVTDNAGFFRIKDAALDKNVALVTAQKAGYFKALRTFSATSGTNEVVIKLIKKNLTGTIDAPVGGEVSLTNGSKVKLPASAVVVASSSAVYTGKINVYAAYIDPTAIDISQTIPGSFMADDKNGSRVTLDSYGMLAVELEGSSGEKLQIKSGSTATLTTAIPSSVQSKAPASISLWSVNEQTGLWKEESTAQKSGSVYVGEVSHFSFWNCDIAIPAIKLTVTLVDKTGLPIVHALVKLSSASNGFAYGRTDSLGVVSGLVPKNQLLSMEILTSCNTSVFTQDIGPFTQNTTLNAITLMGALFDNSYFTLQGSLTNCAGSAVTSGYAIISYGNTSRWVKADATGKFTSSFVHCPGSAISSLQILGVDDAAQQQGTLITVPVNLPTTNAGSISACGTSSQQFVNFTLNGTAYTITAAPLADSTGGTTRATTGGKFSTTLNAFESNKNFFVSFSHNTTTPGVYPVTDYIGMSLNGAAYYAQGNTGVNITFTKFALSLGEFYEGTFSGTFVQGAATHTITNGSFKLRRNN